MAPKNTSYEDVKEQFLSIFRRMGHDPITRNSRPPGYLIVACKLKEQGCGAGCGVSCNQRDAWYTTFWRGGPCVAGTSDKQLKVLKTPAKPVERPPVHFPKRAAVITVKRPQQPVHAAATETAPAAAAPSSAECTLCAVSRGVVWCIRQDHVYCQNCFDHTVKCQVTGDARAAFIGNGCKMCCPYCPDDQSLPSFVMQACANMLHARTYDWYQQCLSEKAVMDTEKVWEKKLQEALAAQKQQTVSPEDIEVQRHADFIIQNLVAATCPKCKGYVPDFEACAAIKCECGAYLCAWCLISVEGDGFRTARVRCHDHVRDVCLFNPHRNVYPPAPHPQIWQGVMNEWGRKRVKDYIQESGCVWCMVDGGVRCMAVRWVAMRDGEVVYERCHRCWGQSCCVYGDEVVCEV